MIESLPAELRIDPITGRKVLIAPGRASRPMTITNSEPQHRSSRHRAVENSFCPFCPGSEWDTPNESYAIREPGSAANGPGWTLRVVPNKFPAVQVHGLSAFGIHEVCVPCPVHDGNPANMSDQQWTEKIIAWRSRLRAFAQDDRLAYAQVFQNVGAEAGASLVHVHSQLVATPFVPDAISDELKGCERFFSEHGHCYFCELPNETNRFIARNAGFSATCPYAPRFSYESWIVPQRHDCRFESICDEEAAMLAQILRRTLTAIDELLHKPAYNFYIHTAPFRTGPLSHYHWHLEIIPRTARAAGYEWGAGVFINTVPPEAAAAQLRLAFENVN